MTTEQRKAWATGLREMADFIDSYEFNFTGSPQTQYVHPDYSDRKGSLAQFARSCGYAKKDFTDSVVKVSKSFSGGVELMMLVDRSAVCERVVVGKRTIPAIPERILAATPEFEVEDVEWHCPSILAPSEAQHEG